MTVRAEITRTARLFLSPDGKHGYDIFHSPLVDGIRYKFRRAHLNRDQMRKICDLLRAIPNVSNLYSIEVYNEWNGGLPPNAAKTKLHSSLHSYYGQPYECVCVAIRSK